jgi:hypothetical protein
MIRIIDEVNQVMRQRFTFHALLVLTASAVYLGCGKPAPDVPEVRVHRAPLIAGDAAIDTANRTAHYVVMVSVDGLASRFIQPMIDQKQLPNFERMQKQGAFTHNARTDCFNTTTLPNHTSMITGLPVSRTAGFPRDAHHGYRLNAMPPPRVTIHNAGNQYSEYVPSVFDVAHDFGLRTCFFASKEKFAVYKTSYDGAHGRPDHIGEDNGRAKIDLMVIKGDSAELVSSFEKNAERAPCHLTFVHLVDLDYTGHTRGWGSDAWTARLVHIDGLLGRILDAVESNPKTATKTGLIVTADHGGTGTGHGDPSRNENFAVPFYVLAPSVPGGSDLYSLASKARFDPGQGNPGYAAARQPIRNGDLGNLALEMMGLPPIPRSLMFGMRLR